jgi:hypothetical protein
VQVNELGGITDWKHVVSKQMEKNLREGDILRFDFLKKKLSLAYFYLL